MRARRFAVEGARSLDRPLAVKLRTAGGGGEDGSQCLALTTSWLEKVGLIPPSDRAVSHATYGAHFRTFLLPRSLSYLASPYRVWPSSNDLILNDGLLTLLEVESGQGRD